MLSQAVLATLVAASAVSGSPITSRQSRDRCTPHFDRESKYIVYSDHSSAWSSLDGLAVAVGSAEALPPFFLEWGILAAPSGLKLQPPQQSVDSSKNPGICIVDPRTAQNPQQLVTTGSCDKPQAIFHVSCVSCNGGSGFDCAVSTKRGDCVTADGMTGGNGSTGSEGSSNNGGQGYAEKFNVIKRGLC
ncbi:hypothetical protein RQP46_001554 [Phenoliferia psychrophenolica]